MSSGGSDRDPGSPGPHGQAQYGQAQHGQAQHGQAQYDQPPEYGAAPYGSGRTSRKTNALAIASLCCGVGQVFVWILAGIPAIALGFLALYQIRQTGEDGRGMAIAGIVLGFIGIILMALFIIFFVAIFH